jgi:hypothetical protein
VETSLYLMNLPPDRTGRPPVNEEHVRSIVSEFDQRLASLSVKERNNRRLVIEAEESTVEWYERVQQGRGVPSPTVEEVRYISDMLEAEAPGLVAKRNAEALVTDLDAIEREIRSSGLNLQDERRLRSEIEDLRRNLLRGGRYIGPYDDAMVRMAALVRKARGEWADNNNLVLERYLGRDRWWMQQSPVESGRVKPPPSP